MASFGTYAGSSVGKKVLVALTGLLLVGFLVVHLLGNLTLLIPDDGEAFNHYAHFLEGLIHGWLIIAFEVGLIAIFLLHGINAITVALVDKERARPQKYAKVANAGGRSHKTLASRSMILTGPVILVFVILHVRMFKFADHPPVPYDGVEMKNLYAVVVEAFKNPAIMVAYLVVMFLLGTPPVARRLERLPVAGLEQRPAHQDPDPDLGRRRDHPGRRLLHPAAIHLLLRRRAGGH